MHTYHIIKNHIKWHISLKHVKFCTEESLKNTRILRYVMTGVWRFITSFLHLLVDECASHLFHCGTFLWGLLTLALVHAFPLQLLFDYPGIISIGISNFSLQWNTKKMYLVYRAAGYSKMYVQKFDEAEQKNLQSYNLMSTQSTKISETAMKTYSFNLVFLFVYGGHSDRWELSHVLGVACDEDAVLGLVLHLLCHWLATTLDHAALRWSSVKPPPTTYLPLPKMITMVYKNK